MNEKASKEKKHKEKDRDKEKKKKKDKDKDREKDRDRDKDQKKHRDGESKDKHSRFNPYIRPYGSPCIVSTEKLSSSRGSCAASSRGAASAVRLATEVFAI